MLKDQFGRTINYMRISVTDRCNLRCNYCNPDGAAMLPGDALLTYEEIAIVCQQAVALGIDRFRLTGGEPLIRPDVPKLVGMIRRIPGVRRLALTTNGVLLRAQLDDLLAAGLDAVNISLDTLNREQYRAITGVDALHEVLAAIRCAVGRLPVKINCVIQPGINDDAPLSLAALARDMPVDVRFIELMPIGAGKDLRAVPNRAIHDRIESRFGRMVLDDSEAGSGPAVYHRPDGFQGRIGFISPIHESFCESCNRLRLTSTGELKPCLCYADVVPLRDILRGDAEDKAALIRESIAEAVMRKPRGHCFAERAKVTEGRRMSQIGG